MQACRATEYLLPPALLSTYLNACLPIIRWVVPPAGSLSEQLTKAQRQLDEARSVLELVQEDQERLRFELTASDESGSAMMLELQASTALAVALATAAQQEADDLRQLQRSRRAHQQG